MCRLGYHSCPACGEEYKCKESDSNCFALNYPHDDSPCGKCEWWLEEERKENERYERMMWERREWEREYGYKE